MKHIEYQTGLKITEVVGYNALPYIEEEIDFLENEIKSRTHGDDYAICEDGLDEEFYFLACAESIKEDILRGKPVVYEVGYNNVEFLDCIAEIPNHQVVFATFDNGVEEDLPF